MELATMIIFIALMVVCSLISFSAYRQGYKAAMNDLDEWIERIKKKVDQLNEFMRKLP